MDVFLYRKKISPRKFLSTIEKNKSVFCVISGLEGLENVYDTEKMIPS